MDEYIKKDYYIKDQSFFGKKKGGDIHMYSVQSYMYVYSVNCTVICTGGHILVGGGNTYLYNYYG